MVLSELRCQTDDVSASSLTRSAVIAAMERAASMGHVLDQDLERGRVTSHYTGYTCVCSCGWRSNTQSKKARAFRHGFEHLGAVIAEGVLGPLPQDSDTGGAEGLARAVSDRSNA